MRGRAGHIRSGENQDVGAHRNLRALKRLHQNAVLYGRGREFDLRVPPCSLTNDLQVGCCSYCFSSLFPALPLL